MEFLPAVLVAVLNDAEVQSASNLPANAETVIYGKVIPFIHRAIALLAFIDIYMLDGSTHTGSIRVFGEWSLDGVNWLPFTGADLIGARTATGQLAGDPNVEKKNFGPLVRFNVGISNDTINTSTKARLSVVVNVRFLDAKMV